MIVNYYVNMCFLLTVCLYDVLKVDNCGLYTFSDVTMEYK